MFNFRKHHRSIYLKEKIYKTRLHITPNSGNPTFHQMFHGRCFTESVHATYISRRTRFTKFVFVLLQPERIRLMLSRLATTYCEFFSGLYCIADIWLDHYITSRTLYTGFFDIFIVVASKLLNFRSRQFSHSLGVLLYHVSIILLIPFKTFGKNSSNTIFGPY